MSRCHFCNARDATHVDELGLCPRCSPTLQRFLAATTRAVRESSEQCRPSLLFRTRLGRLTVLVKRLTVLQAVQDRGVDVGIPDLDSVVRQIVATRRDVVLTELEAVLSRARRQVALAATPRLRRALLHRAAEEMTELARELSEPAAARPCLAALAREIADVHRAEQHAGNEALAFELRKSLVFERYRETLAVVKVTFRPDGEALRQIQAFEATLAQLQDVGLAPDPRGGSVVAKVVGTAAVAVLPDGVAPVRLAADGDASAGPAFGGEVSGDGESS